MKVLDPGHVYELAWVDGNPRPGYEPSTSNRLIFVKREGEKYPGNVGHHPGTQIQEVCRALIDRLKYVDDQEHHEANGTAIYYLREVIEALELRAADRHGRSLSAVLTQTYRGWAGIEAIPTCPKCGHIGCEGGCRDAVD